MELSYINDAIAEFIRIYGSMPIKSIGSMNDGSYRIHMDDYGSEADIIVDTDGDYEFRI